MRVIPEELERLATQTVDAAFQVHNALGPGLLESVYEVCMARELSLRGLRVDRQVEVPVVYKGEKLQAGFRIDLLIESELVVELKAVEEMRAVVYEAQLLTQLKLAHKRLGFLMNFNVSRIKDGIKRMAP